LTSNRILNSELFDFLCKDVIEEINIVVIELAVELSLMVFYCVTSLITKEKNKNHKSYGSAASSRT
jgi:hypothetical protein